MNSGVLYVSGDDEYLLQAEQSAKSVKMHMPETPVAIITDANNPPDIFDIVVTVEKMENTFSDKVNNLHKTPFDRTIFLDTDVYLAESIPEIFSVLEYVDVAASLAITRATHDAGIEQVFPELNTGVIVYNGSTDVSHFLDLYREIYDTNRDKHHHPDQPAFRAALAKSDVRFATLPPEYNCKFDWPGLLEKRAKILHGTPKDTYESVLSNINRKVGLRIHYPSIIGGVRIKVFTAEKLPHQILFYWRRNGFFNTIKKGISELVNKI